MFTEEEPLRLTSEDYIKPLCGCDVANGVIKYCPKHKAAPDMAESGQALDAAIGNAIMKIAQAITLSTALIQIIQADILPAQKKWRKALAKAVGE